MVRVRSFCHPCKQDSEEQRRSNRVSGERLKRLQIMKWPKEIHPVCRRRGLETGDDTHKVTMLTMGRIYFH